MNRAQYSVVTRASFTCCPNGTGYFYVTPEILQGKQLSYDRVLFISNVERGEPLIITQLGRTSKNT